MPPRVFLLLRLGVGLAFFLLLVFALQSAWSLPRERTASGAMAAAAERAAWDGDGWARAARGSSMAGAPGPRLSPGIARVEPPAPNWLLTELRVASADATSRSEPAARRGSRHPVR